MNERIKELIEKSTTIEHGVDNGFDRVTFDKEKFAELIVLECGKIAGKAEYSDTWLEPVEDAIKKHFGVKE